MRVFLLDDHEVVRSGLRALLEASDDVLVVGEAGTVAEALARIPPTRPDVAVLDVRLPDGSGIEVCREIRSRWPEVACVMLTSYADDEALFAAIMAGGRRSAEAGRWHGPGGRGSAGRIRAVTARPLSRRESARALAVGPQ